MGLIRRPDLPTILRVQGSRIEGGGYPWEQDRGGAGSLLSFALGTFTRASEGSYLVGKSRLAWAGVNVPRFEDRGDGHGALHLIEGSRTNRLLRSEELQNAAWSFDNGATVSQDVDTAPDGEADADRINHPNGVGSANSGVRQAYTGSADTQVAVISAWRRLASGSGAARFRALLRDGSVATSPEYTIGTEWERQDFSIGLLTGVSTPDVRCYNSIDEVGRNVHTWGVQVEIDPLTGAATFPSSYIRTTSAQVTRSPDTRSYTPAEVPERMRSGRWRIDFFPYWANTEEIVNHAVIIGFGDANNTLRFDGADDKIHVRQADTARVSSNALTFSRHQRLTIIVDCAEGSIEILGATTGNGKVVGTPWTWAPSTVYIGNVAGILPATGRYAEPRAA